VRGFVDHAARHGGSLLVSGEAGVVKTTLLEMGAAYAASTGLPLLRATGAQFLFGDGGYDRPGWGCAGGLVQRGGSACRRRMAWVSSTRDRTSSFWNTCRRW